ncbi:MAG: hypothetical protein QXT99_09880, partial [Candidatus Nitrosotenuis sp.]
SMVLEKNPVYSEIKNGTIAVWEGDYKLIYYIEKDESSLFNIRIDHLESRDIRSEAVDVAERLQDVITDALKDNNLRLRDFGIINKPE